MEKILPEEIKNLDVYRNNYTLTVRDLKKFLENHSEISDDAVILIERDLRIFTMKSMAGQWFIKNQMLVIQQKN